MKSIKEILRLASDGNLSVRRIAKSCNCSPTTVSAVIDLAKSADLTLDWLNQMPEEVLENRDDTCFSFFELNRMVRRDWM